MLEKCNICNIGLVEAIKEKVEAGQTVMGACKEYEDYQKKVNGEVVYSADALRNRYATVLGRKKRQYVRNVGKKEAGSYQLVGLFDIHLDPDDGDLHPAEC